MIRPQIGSGCFIAPSASIIGEVTLGNDTSVWFSAVIRGDAPINIGAVDDIDRNLHC
jgi:carbonic anhydrase/acetyltransferase-like protein (isoleucine patch superfamily)